MGHHVVRLSRHTERARFDRGLSAIRALAGGVVAAMSPAPVRFGAFGRLGT
jgi:hypothetical protein